MSFPWDAGVSLIRHTRGAYVDEHYMTNVEGIFAAGNVLHVHDLVDYVSQEAERLAASAAAYITGGSLPACPLPVECGENVGHVLPQRISGTSDFQLSLRVRKPPAELQDRCHTGRSRSILAQDAQGDPRGDDPI